MGLPPFQSHFGSIGAHWARPPGRRRRPFNPTLVRLGLSPLRGLCPGRGAFNPTLVRLGPGLGAAARARRPPFNPTLVRLGHREAEGFVGRLRAAFNPTLVRLGPARPPGARHRAALSIPLWFDWGGCTRGGYPSRRPDFQSHFGSIGAWPSNCGKLSGSCFQSHFGSIGAGVPGGGNRFLSRLSIPLWFDWGLLLVLLLLAPALAAFNPTLVRLGRQCPALT